MIEYNFPQSSLSVDEKLLKELKGIEVDGLLSMLISHRSSVIYDTKRWSIVHVDRSIRTIKKLRSDLKEKDGETESVSEIMQMVERILDNLKRDLEQESPVFL